MGVPTPVGVKIPARPAPPARRRSTRVPCGTTSKVTWPDAAFWPAADSTLGRETKETMRWETWLFSMSCAAGPPTPLATNVRFLAPCWAAAAKREFGTPELRPKPEMEIDAPSGISATASSGVPKTLSTESMLREDNSTYGGALSVRVADRVRVRPSRYPGGRGGKERGARNERSSDWPRGAEPPAPKRITIPVMEPMYEMPAEQAAEALMASMKLNGIDRLWFTSGTELAFFQEVPVKHQALGRPTPRIMTMTHENAAMGAAMGETMITGRPSSTAAHVECGMINAGGSIHNADRGHYPVLMMSGYPPSAETGSVPGARDAGIQWYQQIPDQGQIVRQYMRWDHKLASYDNPGTVVTRACQVMLSEPQGPAYLAIPREAAMRPMDGARFPLLSGLPPAKKPVADPAQLRHAAKWLLEAERPLICVSRVGRDPSAVRGVVELAESLGAQVMADGYRVNIPAGHPLAVQGGPMSGPPSDVDCILVLDMLVPWAMPMYRPGPTVKVITL